MFDFDERTDRCVDNRWRGNLGKTSWVGRVGGVVYGYSAISNEIQIYVKRTGMG